MYIPMFKNRMYENKILKERGNLFVNDKIMPLIEIIDIEKKGIEGTIEFYDDIIESNYFIDFFSFKYEDYIPYTIDKVRFSFSLVDEKTYKYLDDLLVKTTISKKAIPVISIKKSRPFILDRNVIRTTIEKLQAEKEIISVRLEVALYDDYFESINELLRKDDYLLLDIGNNKIDPVEMTLTEFSMDKKEYKSILLNSPRNKNLTNGKYENLAYTNLIDNKVAREYANYEFDGFGDYLGLKDELPNVRGSNGQGAAHCLFYNHKNNKFYSIVDYETSYGSKGYKNVVDQLKTSSVSSELNSDNDCLAFEYINKEFITTFGNFAKWKYVLMLRTLSEMKKVYK